MYLLVLLLPLISSLFVLFFGKLLGRRGVFSLVFGSLVLGLIISWLLFYEICLLSGVCSFWGYEWISSGLFVIRFGFLLDSLSSVVLVVVFFISFVVHLYSLDYLCYEPHMMRFLAYLSLFTFFMLIVISSNNFMQMFLGWEGVGLVSYLLITFWFMRLEANKAAIKALLVNRVGDLGIILAFLFIYLFFKSFAYPVIFVLAPWYEQEFFVLLGIEIHKLSLISFLLFFGCIAKSAQVGLHTWLVAAMEGPTPVSALLHAATMVTVGVFVVVRCSVLFEYSMLVLLFVAFMGSLTAFFGAIAALFQNDIKKIVACSTSSQLGYMFFSCGLSNYSIGLSHLLAHSFFKALLFLGVGLVIHGCSSEQDLRRFGGLVMIVPIVYVSILVGSLSLAGFPFLAGFYSKDYLLGLASFSGSLFSMFVYFLGGISVFFTCAYSFKLLYLVFFLPLRVFVGPVYYIQDVSYVMCLCLLILVFFSLFEGCFCADIFLGEWYLFWGVSSSSLWIDLRFLEVALLSLGYRLFPLVCICGGLGYVLFFYVYFYFVVIGEKFLVVCVFFNQLWYFDYLYSKAFVEGYISFCHRISYLFMDRGYLEIWGPYGVIWFLDVGSSRMIKMESGYIGQYLFAMLCGIVSICGWFCFRLGGVTIIMWLLLVKLQVVIIGVKVSVCEVWMAVIVGGVPVLYGELWWNIVRSYIMFLRWVELSIGQMFHGGGDWLPDLSSWGGIEYLLSILFFFFILGCDYLFHFVSNLLYCDYFYFLELIYILILSIFFFILGDFKNRLWVGVKDAAWTPVLERAETFIHKWSRRIFNICYWLIYLVHMPDLNIIFLWKWFLYGLIWRRLVRVSFIYMMGWEFVCRIVFFWMYWVFSPRWLYRVWVS